MQSTEIPDKVYFKIGEVSELTGVKPYVLRYWESEFNIVKPSKSISNQRMYKKKEVELILEIKRLLYEDKFTIAGAKKILQEKARQNTAGTSPNSKTRDVLVDLREMLVEIKKLVEVH
jgi:DNA-binding transcriptional MerR regulator